MALGFKVWVCGQIYGLMFIARDTYTCVLVANFALKNLGKHVRTSLPPLVGQACLALPKSYGHAARSWSADRASGFPSDLSRTRLTPLRHNKSKCHGHQAGDMIAHVLKTSMCANHM